MSHRNNFYCITLILLSTFIMTACESWLPDAHRPDYTQGNVIKREDLDKIQTGMNKSEITSILGTPMITDPFHAQRWDYIYRFLPGRGDILESRVTLFFENDVLIRIDDSEYREPEASDEKADSEPAPVEPVPKPDLD